MCFRISAAMGFRPTDIELHVAALNPTQIVQRLHESPQAGLILLIVFFPTGKD